MNYRGIVILVLANFLVGDEASRIFTKELEEIIGNEKDEQQSVLEDKTSTELKNEVAYDTAAIDTLNKIQTKKTIADVFKFITKPLKNCEQKIVAVHATVSRDIRNVKDGQKIIFDEVLINLNNGYDPVYGVFRAPVGGIYVVLVTVSSSKDAAPDYEVVHQGIVVCRASVNAKPVSWIASPCNSVLFLKPNDEVFARILTPLPTDIIRGERFTTFSVTLVAAS